jgi:hypothetical protein
MSAERRLPCRRRFGTPSPKIVGRAFCGSKLGGTMLRLVVAPGKKVLGMIGRSISVAAKSLSPAATWS